MARDKFDLVNPDVRAHRGKSIRDISSTLAFERYTQRILNSPARVTSVPAAFAGRPDLISNSAYGTPDYWWVICLANNIIDPVEQLIGGKQIKIPIIT